MARDPIVVEIRVSGVGEFRKTVRLLTRTIRAVHRVRGTGHRHFTTRDHDLRYAPGRRDLPLGTRTLAKSRGG